MLINGVVEIPVRDVAPEQDATSHTMPVEEETKFTFSCLPSSDIFEDITNTFRTAAIAATYSARVLSISVVAILDQGFPALDIYSRRRPFDLLFVYFNMVFWTLTCFGIFSAHQESEPPENPLALTQLKLNC